jgi:hypothetical protein
MFAWLRRRREAARRVEADVAALLAGDRDEAYFVARCRQRESSSAETARHWGRVAQSIARRTGKRVGLDTATRMAMDADFTSDREIAATPPQAAPRRVDPVDELKRMISERPGRIFRLQFLGVRTGRAPAILGEREIQAVDASEAMRAAADVPWAPRIIGLRLVDAEGRKVFERLKADDPDAR